VSDVSEQGALKPAMTMAEARCAWNPGLDNDHLTLGEVLGTLPGDEQGDVPWLVRLFENPASPIAFKGAIGLERHDCVHVLLGRGLLQQDEAFVIGFTMGSSKTISGVESWLFEQVCTYVMPPKNRFDPDEKQAFRIGLELGKRGRCTRIYETPIEAMQRETIGVIRERVGIDKAALRAAYAFERALVPHTDASRRLPG